MNYRPEIDGLRALSILPVVLFHAGFSLFDGGFIGVDIFFVISGYLITTIIINDIEINKFSVSYFYERRARRILPAMFVIILVCIPFSYLLMLPSQIINFSESIVAVTFFVSNIFFWQKTGYFTQLAEETPLLHMWSLAVEEQFYLLFPLLILIIYKFGKSKLFWIIFIFILVSIALSEWGWRNKSIANFYLLPSNFFLYFTILKKI